MIQRYHIGIGPMDCPDTEEAEDGDWVKWEDVERCVGMWDTLTGMMQNCCSCETHRAIEDEIEKYWQKCQ